MDGHRVREDQRKLLPVHVELFQHKESALYLFHLVLVGGMIKFDLHVAGGNVSDRTNGTIHQATLCVKISLQHDSCPDCNVQHSFQAGCQVAVLLVEPVKFGCGFLGPLLCTGGLVNLIRTENLDSIYQIPTW